MPVHLIYGAQEPAPTCRANIIRWLLKKEQMVVSAIASTPHNGSVRYCQYTSLSSDGCA
ncbi:Transposase [Shigella dysenteriae 1617]|uniref:Transposase n=1 Tax=Shigella dysenteriae 1617 TaxID=754093 RepID=A0A0A6ZU19_SHIDY|nr:Transposase [Shigella dysenteriae 1617]